MVVWDVLLIFFLRVLGISVSTLSTILTVQGRRMPAILTGSLNTFVYVLAIGKVVNNLDNPWNIAAYVAGFAVGTWVGMVLEGRIALGNAEVRIISTRKGQEIATALREAGFGVTQLYGHGQESSIVLIDAFVPRKSVPEVLRIVDSMDEKAIVAVAETRTLQRAYWRKSEHRR
jgi:uncharacterized protein YebE (UPF0316 family)